MTWGRDTDEHEAREQFDAFTEAGGTLVDTADVYTDGDSERLVGRIIAERGVRDDVVLATKAVGTPHADRRRNATRAHLLSALDASLARLGTDHVDLWQMHAWDPQTPIDETLSAIDTAVASGRVRYAGISNYSGWQTAQAASLQSARPGGAPLISTQVEYSLLARGVEREVVPAAQALGLGILPWSPLGRGVLTGKYRTGLPADSRGASPHFAGFVRQYLDHRSTQIVEAVCTAADGLQVSPLEIALAWVRDRPGVVAPVIGARTASQLRLALASEDLELPGEIGEALDEVSAPDMGYPEKAYGG
jgi:aryl-alcohol dehydrogenase-like predicted oxidoreductase